MKDMVLDMEDPQGSITKQLELTNELSKVVGYKIIIWKSIAFLYSNNKLSEYKENNHIYNSIRNNKILINKFN